MQAADVKSNVKNGLGSVTLSTPNLVALIGVAALLLLVALRFGFRPLNLG